MAATFQASNWQEIKDFVDARGGPEGVLFYFERPNAYELVASDYQFQIEFRLDKNPGLATDLNDFENNYKSGSNLSRGIIEGRSVDTDFLSEVAKGNITNHESFNLSGFSSTVGTTGATVWNSAGFYQFPSSAETLEIFSSSEDDNSAGIGARTVRVIGLDANYEVIQEDLNLSGTTVVTSSSSFLRINETVVISSGTNDSNVGDITVRNSISQTVLSSIISGRGIAQQAVRTVPAGRKALFYGGFVSLAKNGLLATLNLRSGSTGVVRDLLRLEIGADRFDFSPPGPTLIGEKSDIWVNANTKAGETSATAFLNVVLVG